MDLGGIFSRAGLAARGYREERGEQIDQAAALERLRAFRLQREQAEQEVADEQSLRRGLLGVAAAMPGLRQGALTVNPDISQTVTAPAPAPPPPQPPPPAPPPATAPTRVAPPPASASPARTAAAPAGTREETEAIMRGNIPASVASTRQTPSPGTRIASAESRSSLLDQTIQDLIPESIRDELERRQELEEARAAAATAPVTAAAPAPTTAAATATATPAATPAPAPTAGMTEPSAPALNGAALMRGQVDAPTVLRTFEEMHPSQQVRRIEQTYAMQEELLNVYIKSGRTEAAVQLMENMLGLQIQYDMAVGLDGLGRLRSGDPRVIESFLIDQTGVITDINPVLDNEGRWTRSFQVTENGTVIEENISVEDLSNFIRSQFDSAFQQQQREAAAALAEATYQLQREEALLWTRGTIEQRLDEQRALYDVQIAEIEAAADSGKIEITETSDGRTFVIRNGNVFLMQPDTTPGAGGHLGESTVRLIPIRIPRI